MGDVADMSLARRIPDDVYAPARDIGRQLVEYAVWT